MKSRSSSSAAIQFLDITDSLDRPRLSFRIDGLDLSVVNALRRTILTDIPNVSMFFSPYDPSINHVFVEKNTSAIHNEMVGHRMSLIPVCITENDIVDVKTNPNKFRFVLNVKNTTSNTISVTTKDIVIYENGLKAPDARHAAMFPVDPVTKDHILLLKLRPNPLNPTDGEEIALEASLSVGTAKQHACYCPVSVCYFTNIVDSSLVDAAFASYVSARISSATGQDSTGPATLGPAEIEEARREFLALDAQRCFPKNQHGEPGSFSFTIESECRLRPAYMFMKAFMVLQARVAALREAVLSSPDEVNAGDTTSDATKSIVRIVKTPSIPGLFHVHLMHEGHTMGNLLQSLIFNKHIRQGKSAQVEYVGYHQPHPLEDYVYLKVKLADTLSPDEATLRQVLDENLLWIQKVLVVLALQWYDDAKCQSLKAAELDAFVKLHEGLRFATLDDLRFVACLPGTTAASQEPQASSLKQGASSGKPKAPKAEGPKK
jgi:DNA-directed RNA polymerase subunit L